MKPAPQREEALFQAATRLTSAERAIFLDGTCRGDPVLRQRLEALLAAHEQADDFLATQPEAVGPTVKLDLVDGPVDDAVGLTIGRYKVLEKVGEGGGGVVYVAEQTEPVRRRVALKVIKLGMDTKQVVARFEAERQALAMMDHPNIAKVLDAGTTEGGRAYFVMELVRGILITDYCDQNNLPTKERLDLFIKVCHAIQHAHQKGIIHRDIKPSNILVTLHDGVPVPKVIDFGIAKATEGRLTDATVYTQLHQFIGTPAYMSPEQAEMGGLDIDTRSDIYSLGVLLYELLTGNTPFDAKELMESGIDAMRKTIREKEPMRPSTRLKQELVAVDVRRRTAKSELRNPKSEMDRASSRRLLQVKELVHLLRGDLDWIVMKCLEKDRTRRYETANGLAADLKRHLNHELVVARPPSTTYKFQKAWRRNKLVIGAATAVGVALLVGLGFSTWQFLEKSKAYQRAVAAERTQSRSREEAQKAQANEAQLRRDAEVQQLAARQRAYASDMNLAQQSIALNNFGRAKELLDRHRPARKPETDLRGWEWRYLWQFCQSDALYTLCQQTNTVPFLTASQDGRWVAVGEFENGGFSVWDLRTRQEVARPIAGAGVVRAAFSPRDPLLAFSSATMTGSRDWQCAVHLWDVATRRVVAELPIGGECKALTFAEDGRTLATIAAGPEAAVTLWSVPDGRKLASHPADRMAGMGAWFPATRDLRVAAYAMPGGWIRVIDLGTGQERWSAKAADEAVIALAFSPDGKVLASSAGFVEGTIRLWDVASGNETARLEGHRGWVASLVFWPDGKTLASASADQTIRLWDVANVRPLAVLRGHNVEVWGLTLLSDNATLVSGGKDGSVLVWDTTKVRREPTPISLPDKFRDWCFAPDGKSVITVDWRDGVARWQCADFQEKQRVQEIGPTATSVLLSRDGRRVATGSSNGKIRVWDLEHGTLLRELSGQTGTVVPLAFLRRGDGIIARHADDSLHEWDLSTGREGRSWQAAAQLSAWAISPDEQWCATFGYGGASVLRNLSTVTETKLGFGLRQAKRAAFSPDGKLFAVVSLLGIGKVWSIDPLREVGTLHGFLQGIHSVAFSPDGSRIAAGGDGKEAIKLWDVASYQELLTFEADGSNYEQTAFSPDGNVIGSMNNQGILNLWRAPSLAEIEAVEQADRK